MSSSFDSKLAEQLRIAIDVIGEAFVIYDKDGRLVICNEKFRQIYGYTREETAPGVHFRELGKIDVERGNVVVGDAYGSGEAYLQRKAEYRNTLEGSFTVKLRDGRWLKTTDRRMPDGGFASVQADITDLKVAEESMLRAMQEAEKSNRAKSEFLAKMSHELRTPLNSIIGFSELLTRNDPVNQAPDKVRTYADTIHVAGSHLLKLINDILDVAKVEAGRLSLEEDKVDVADEIERCIHLVSGAVAVDEKPEIRSEVPDGLCLKVDARRFRQILLNILSNAFRFTPAAGEIDISVDLDADQTCTISVSDTGIGISDADQERVMQPFEQSAPALVAAGLGAGTGLGLPIAVSLVELHGGTLTLTSQSGAGTKVDIVLPPSRVLGDV